VTGKISIIKLLTIQPDNEYTSDRLRKPSSSDDSKDEQASQPKGLLLADFGGADIRLEVICNSPHCDTHTLRFGRIWRIL
jgi:hypothetical protein